MFVKEIEEDIANGAKYQEQVVNDTQNDKDDSEDLKWYKKSRRKQQQKSWLDIDPDDERQHQQDRNWYSHNNAKKNSGPRYNPETMTELDVRRWLHSNQIHEAIIKYLSFLSTFFFID